MYQKICKWCNENIIVEKQTYFALHVSNCQMNPRDKSNKYKGLKRVERVTLIKKCLKCDNKFEITATQSEIKRNKLKKYCSYKCGNSNKRTEEQKKKISEINRNSEKVKIANKRIGIEKKEKRHSLPIETSKCEVKLNNEYTFTCLYCKEIGYDNRWNKNRKYHKECWLKASGGIRQGSSNCKKGWYNGFWCDSSYELAFLIYCLENKKKIERNSKGFEYVYLEETHKFYPDFIVDNEYVEIKNYRSELTDSKISHFPHKITIYYKDTIKPFLEYTINKYGKDFIKLYKTMTTTQQQPQQQINQTD